MVHRTSHAQPRGNPVSRRRGQRRRPRVFYTLAPLFLVNQPAVHLYSKYFRLDPVFIRFSPRLFE